MKYYTLLLMCLSFSSFAVTNKDIDIMNNKSFQYYKTNPDSALYYAELSLEYSLANNYYEGIWRSSFNAGYINYKYLKNDTKAITLLLQADLYCPTSENSKSEIITTLGRILEKHNHYKKALKFYKAGLIVANKKNRSKLFLNMGNAYKKSGLYDSALLVYIECLNSSIETNNKSRAYRAHNQIGLVLTHAGEYEKARVHFYNIINDQSIDNYPKYAGRAFHNIANTYNESGEYQKAAHFYKTALNTKKSYKEKFISYMDQSQNLFDMGKFDQAKARYTVAINHLQLVDKHPDNFKVFKLMAANCFKMGNPTEAYLYEKQYSDHSDIYTTYKDKIVKQIDRNQVDTVIDQYYLKIEQKQIEEQWVEKYQVLKIVLYLLALISIFLLTKYLIRRRQILMIINS